MNRILEIYLPASAPDNLEFGKIPDTPAIAGNTLINVKFAKEVWYNQEWRKKAIAQFLPVLDKNNILIGFSKSGLGALNIAMENPTMFHAVIIFDSPLMYQKLPAWNTSPFYSQLTWEDDFVGNRLNKIKSLSDNTKIIHIGGAHFHKDHKIFHNLLKAHDIQHYYLSRPQLSHNWGSGWLFESVELASLK